MEKESIILYDKIITQLGYNQILFAMESEISVEFAFREQLQQHHLSKKHNSVLISKADYFNLIQELKDANSSETKCRRQYHVLSRFVAEIYVFVNSYELSIFLQIFTTKILYLSVNMNVTSISEMVKLR